MKKIFSMAACLTTAVAFMACGNKAEVNEPAEETAVVVDTLDAEAEAAEEEAEAVVDTLVLETEEAAETVVEE